MVHAGDSPVFKDSTPRRYGVVALHVLFVAYIFVASVVSLADP